ncbi:MAG: SGNH/GDSL hydrolase family protein, partial [Clostridiales bacterium]|nr:SGNH/GDSL hydrolase family protein [Clostridiales bacterium]
MPKYMSEIPEGNLVEEYYKEEKKHDVIFVGDCEVFSNISPVTLWEKYGITSYIRGSAQQLIWQSYYLLEETIKYEKPKAVVFNVLAMKYNKPQKEAYNRLTLDGMKLSKQKIGAIKASMMDDEDLITYIFPLLRYHSRWNDIK